MLRSRTLDLRLFRAKLVLKRQISDGKVWLRPVLALVRGAIRIRRPFFPRAGGPRGAEATGILPCPVPFREMVINCDGTVACGSTAKAPILDRFLAQGPGRRFSDIWNGARFRGMRSRMLARDGSACQGCVLYKAPGFKPVSEWERAIGSPEGYADGALQQLLIEPTAQCNFDCPTICGQSYPKSAQPVERRTVRFMPMDLYKRIVEGIDQPIRRICFYNYGEPTLHPHLGEMIRLMRAKCPEAYIYTSTNGSRLKEPGVRAALLGAGLDEILVSIDGARQESYGLYRKGGCLEEILEALRQLRRERDLGGSDRPRITWRYILFAWNDSEEELALAERLAQDVGVDRFCYHLSDLPELASRVFQPGLAAFERVRPWMF